MSVYEINFWDNKELFADFGGSNLTGYEYEKKCAELLKAKGFTDVKVTPGSGDQGIDILAKKSRKKYGVQCKYYEGSVGNKAVQEAFAGASYY
ncbi:restriction endonuclease [Eubacteriales bacterium SGI.150]